MPRDWRAAIGGFSRVMKLVHLAARYDQVVEAEYQTFILREARKAYENELTIQASRMGCARQGRLTNPDILSTMREEAKADAASIVNTYNYDLAVGIAAIRQANPRSNRHVYAFRLRKWHDARERWKHVQISLMTENKARRRAQQDFVMRNRAEGFAILRPTTAVCPVCQGWINRGRVPLKVAMKNPAPYHVGCPHIWEIESTVASRRKCEDLWLGQ